MAAKEIIFGDMNPKEIEDFEKKTDGLIIHNSIGYNSLFISPSINQLVVSADKIENGEDTDYPNRFFLSEQDLIRLYNFLGEFFIKRPNVYQIHLPNNEPTKND